MATDFDREMLKGRLKTNTEIRGGMGGNQWIWLLSCLSTIGNGIIYP
jgi:hypothetical protein